jgi:hypothetical protein
MILQEKEGKEKRSAIYGCIPLRSEGVHDALSEGQVFAGIGDEDVGHEILLTHLKCM